MSRSTREVHEVNVTRLIDEGPLTRFQIGGASSPASAMQAPPKLDAFNTDRRLSAIRYSDYRNSDYRTTLKRMCGQLGLIELDRLGRVIRCKRHRRRVRCCSATLNECIQASRTRRIRGIHRKLRL